MDFTLDKKHEMARTLFKEFAEKEVKPLAQMALCIWYNVGDANPEGPAIISSVIK